MKKEFVTSCTSWYGHNFQPRYDESTDIKSGCDVFGSRAEFTKINVLDFINALKVTKKVYVHDICIHCGETVKRQTGG